MVRPNSLRISLHVQTVVLYPRIRNFGKIINPTILDTIKILQNILAGALYGPVGGLIFVCIFTAFGATLAYIISKTFYRQIIHQFFPERFRLIESKITENRDKLLYFMIFIRVVPVSPGWAINLFSPLVNVPIHIFFVTTLIGKSNEYLKSNIFNFFLQD